MVDVIEIATYDTAIGLTGHGRFHWELFAVCSLCFLTSGFENGISAYFVPAARCELNLTSSQVGLIIASFLIGGTLSAILWGVIADLAGRRIVILSTLIAAAGVSVLSSFSPNFFTLFMARFANGFLMGAPGSITYSYLAEFYAPSDRSRKICYSGIFYTLSWLLLPVIAWMVIPLGPVRGLNFGADFGSWRLLLVVIALPEFICGFWLMNLPESPKYLLVQGNSKTALKVLKEIYAKNNPSKKPEDFPVRTIIGENLSVPCTPVQVICRGKSARLLYEIVKQIKCLFRPPNLIFITLANVMLFANVFGYYGLGLWIPQLFSAFPEQAETTNATSANLSAGAAAAALSTSVCELYSKHMSESAATSLKSCVPSLDTTVFSDTLVVGFCCIVGNVLSGWISGKISPKVIPVATLALGAAASGALYWAYSRTQTLVIACVFQTAMATANMALNSVCVNLFPTAISGLAVAVATMSGRIGAMVSNIVFGSFMEHFCMVPLFMVTATLVVGALFGLYIPNLDEEATDAEKSAAKISAQDLHCQRQQDCKVDDMLCSLHV